MCKQRMSEQLCSSGDVSPQRKLCLIKAELRQETRNKVSYGQQRRITDNI